MNVTTGQLFTLS